MPSLQLHSVPYKIIHNFSYFQYQLLKGNECKCMDIFALRLNFSLHTDDVKMKQRKNILMAIFVWLLKWPVYIKKQYGMG